MGVKSDGTPDRRHRRAKAETEARRKVKELEKARDAGRAPKAGRIPTVAEWMTPYLDTIAARKLKPRSLDDYWSKTRNDIIPHLGKHRLDRLRPEHLDAAYGALLDAGHAPSHVLKVHRILSRALKIAHRRELVGRNVATLIDPPTVEQQETETFSQKECRTFLRAAAELPTGMRWAVGVGLGIQQGEALGLRWSYVNLDAGYLRTWWQLQRLTWRHGCADPHACGARLHHFDPCPPDCRAHKAYKRGCPKPCPPGCTRHTAACPERESGGLVFTSPKTKKSGRFLPIPPPMIPLLREHKARQEAARELAGELWQENDLVFACPDGRPLDPRQDWQEFEDLLAAAGIRDLRLHDSRHTAGTILNELGVGSTTIMEIFGHTQLSMTGRYVHGSTALTEEAMRRMGAALYPETQTRTETTPSRAERAKRRRRIR